AAGVLGSRSPPRSRRGCKTAATKSHPPAALADWAERPRPPGDLSSDGALEQPMEQSGGVASPVVARRAPWWARDRALIGLGLLTASAFGWYLTGLGGLAAQVIVGWLILTGLHAWLAVLGWRIGRLPGAPAAAGR